MRYVCAHCNADLGPVVSGQPEAQCADHPEGIVYQVADPPTDAP